MIKRAHSVALFFAATSHLLFGQVLYLGNAGDDTVSAYVIDQQTGLLTELVPRVSSPGSPSSVAPHPSGKFVYVTNSGNAALGATGPSVAVYSIDPGSGALTLAGTLPLTPGTGPQGAAVDAAGKFLFVANGGGAGGNVSVYSIDASTGALSPVPGSPFTTPPGPNKVVVHPNGKFAYAAAAAAGQIAAFNIAANGALTAVAGSPFAAANRMSWMAMDPAGKFLFAAEAQDNAILAYSIDATTGALTAVPGSPFSQAGGALGGITVDRSGKFLYIANGSGSVTMFAIAATGALSGRTVFQLQIPGASDTILDPSGKFLYVPGTAFNGIGAFALNATTGAPTPLTQRPYPAGVQPIYGAAVLLSPPVLPPVTATSAVNYYSNSPAGMPNAGIAQGSRMAISGTNIGPATPVNSRDFPLQTQLGGTTVQIQSGDVTTAALVISTSNTVVYAVVPSTTPLGDATVTVSYNGRTTAPAPITIVATSVGIRTRGDQGSGPARARNGTPDTGLNSDIAALPFNTFTQSATPGQVILLETTGLGPVDADETQNLTLVVDLPADVLVANKPATVITKVRLAAGVDGILFQLPDDVPLGCYVPIAVQAGGVTSNVATLSIAANGGTCTDPAGLAAADIDAAQKSGQIRMGTVIVGHIGFEFGVGTQANDFVNGIFGRYDFDSLLQTYSPGNNGEGIRGAFVTPALGACAVTPGYPSRPNNPFDAPGDQTPFLFLNAGAALNVNGPSGSARAPAPGYTVDFDGNAITPGDYTVDNAAGTAAVGPFKAAITLPQPVQWTNQNPLGVIDRTQDLTVTWTGGNADKEFVMIAGLSNNAQAVSGFLCTEKASAGKFTVPAWVLSTLPASALFPQGGQPVPGGLLGVGTAPLSSGGRFNANGLDYGVISYEQAILDVVVYQ